jgi:hypothetical protein
MNYRFCSWLNACLCALGFVSLHFSSSAQLPGTSWSLLVDGYNSVVSGGCAVDTEGNSFFGLQYQTDLKVEGLNKKFAPSPYMHSALVKVSPAGKPLWGIGIRSARDNRIRDVRVAANGDVLITGFADGQVIFESTDNDIQLGRQQRKEEIFAPSGIFVASYSTKGQLRWVRFLQGVWGEGLSVCSNSTGEVAVTGHCTAPLLDEAGSEAVPFTGNRGNDQHRFVWLLHADGKTREIRSLGYERSSMAIIRLYGTYDRTDHLILYGTFHNQMMIAPGDSIVEPHYQGGLDSFIARYRPDGGLVWKQHIGGASTQWLRDVEVGPDNSLYLAGTWSQECVWLTNAVTTASAERQPEYGDHVFHGRLFSDGSLDYLWFYRHHRAGFSSIPHQIGVDSHGILHAMGNVNDTIRMGAHEVFAGYHNSQPFYMRWKRDECEAFTLTGRNDEHFIHPFHFAMEGERYAGTGSYYGGKGYLLLGDKKRSLTIKDNGGAVVLYGGTLPPRPKEDEDVLAQQERQNTTREEVLSALKCLDENAPEVWLPLESEVTIESLPDVPETVGPTELVPCATQAPGMEALVYPNPARGQATLTVRGAAGTVMLEVLDEKGRLVHSRGEQVLTYEHHFPLNLINLAPGTWFLRITSGSHFKVLRLVVVG